MKPVIQHLGTVKEWKFIPDNPSFFLDEIKKQEGKRVSVILKSYRPYKQRSIEQNSYYWGVVVQILSDEFGYKPDEIHEILKFKFLAKQYDLNGKIFTGTDSSASLDTLDMERYLSTIRGWASQEFGIFIPQPNESPIAYEYP